MTVARIDPSIASGSVTAPPSKSYTHRALIAGYLADRVYRVGRPLDADDTRATAGAVEKLGTPVRRDRDAWTLRPDRRPARSEPVTIDCGESGTTLRFVAALAARGTRSVTLRGRGRLPTRPMRPLWSALRELGASVRSRSKERRLPVVVHGPIRAGTVDLDASESSQFASGLLLVLPTLDGDSVLRLSGRIVSRPFLAATLKVLEHHGVEVGCRGREYRVPGGQRFDGDRIDVPGDASSAAYFWAAAALTGGEVTVAGLPRGWPQADLSILDLLERAGAKVRRTDEGATVRGNALRPFTFDLTDAPDLYPLAGTLAAAIPGSSRLVGAPHVAFKESDRRAGTARLARAFGAQVTVEGERLRIEGTGRPRPIRLRDEHDHRVVMSAAVGALAGSGRSSIADAGAVAKSFPRFWSELADLAGGVHAA